MKVVTVVAVLLAALVGMAAPARGVAAAAEAQVETVETAKVCDEDRPLRIAFLILVHNKDTLDGCSRLIDALYHEDHTFYVHFDTKMQAADYDYEWRLLAHGRGANLRKLSQHNLQWGKWVMLAPWFTVAKMLVAGGRRRGVGITSSTLVATPTRCFARSPCAAASPRTAGT